MKSAAGDRCNAGLRRQLARLALVATGAALAAGCSDAVPEAQRVPSSHIEQESQLRVDVTPTGFDAPAATDAPARPSEGARSATAPVSRESGTGASASSETVAPSAEVHVPLESLLRAPHASDPKPEPPLDLGVLSAEPAAIGAPASRGALERWKIRVRVERRSEPIGPSGPRQGTLSETEARLRVPLDDSLSVEGGVRVDQREEPETREPQRTSIPRVGVEVKF